MSARDLLHRPRLRRLMEQARLDAVVAASPVNVAYTSGYRSELESVLQEWMIRPGGGASRWFDSFCIVPSAGEPVLIAPAIFAPDVLGSWVEDVHLYGEVVFEPGDTFGAEERFMRLHAAQERSADARGADVLVRVLKDCGLRSARIGIDVDGVHPGLLSLLRVALPHACLLDCSNLLRLTRMVKTEGEIACLVGAAAINEQGLLAGAAVARPGATIGELAAAAQAEIAACGGVSDHVSIGVRGIGFASSHHECVLRDGDVFAFDIGCAFGGYIADTATTVAVGDGESSCMRSHEGIYEATATVGVGEMRPGVKLSQVYEAMCAVLVEHGLAGRPQCHGIGRDLRDYPIFSHPLRGRIRDDCVDEPADIPLESGMVVNVECALHSPGIGSVAVEVTAVVTADGARKLLPQEREKLLQPHAVVSGSLRGQRHLSELERSDA